MAVEESLNLKKKKTLQKKQVRAYARAKRKEFAKRRDEGQGRKEHCLWERPDWRDVSKYQTDDNKLSDDQWRWEFLRRSQEYMDDYVEQKEAYPFKYGMREWIPPSQKKSPIFLESRGREIIFSKNEDESYFHYLALKEAQRLGLGFLFSIDATEPLQPQFDKIEIKYDEIRKHLDKRGEWPLPPIAKMNNTAEAHRRPRGYLLRILDGMWAGVKKAEMHRELGNGKGEAVSYSAFDRSVTYALDFWKKFSA
jgi:hypothetical protein